MKKLLLLITVISILSCSNSSLHKPTIVQELSKSKSDETIRQEKKDINQILESKFGKPLTAESRDDVFMIYTWTSFENEYGRKFKNEIDKFLDILPQKTDTKLKNESGNAVITDTYEWETPTIFVAMDDEFMDVGGKIKTKITIMINQK